MSKIEDALGCPKCGGEILAVEYAVLEKYHYDGISEYACINGDYRRGAFCGQELTDKAMVEPVDCKGVSHPRIWNLNDKEV